MDEVRTKKCPYCAETIRAEAIKCRYCGSRIGAERTFSRPWHRRRRGRMVAGVCTGLADEFGVSVTVVRLAFVLAVVLGWGVGIILYIALWLIMPYHPEDEREAVEDRP